MNKVRKKGSSAKTRVRDIEIMKAGVEACEDRNVAGSAGECEVFQEMPISLAILIVAHSVD